MFKNRLILTILAAGLALPALADGDADKG